MKKSLCTLFIVAMGLLAIYSAAQFVDVSELVARLHGG